MEKLAEKKLPVEQAGLDKAAVKAAIEADLNAKAGMPAGQFLSGSVNVGGRTLRYNAFKLNDG